MLFSLAGAEVLEAADFIPIACWRTSTMLVAVNWLAERTYMVHEHIEQTRAVIAAMHVRPGAAAWHVRGAQSWYILCMRVGCIYRSRLLLAVF